MDILVYILFFVFGFLMGVGFLWQATKDKAAGTLRIDQSDPEDGPYFFLELGVDPRTLTNEKIVTFKVNTESYLSQK